MRARAPYLAVGVSRFSSGKEVFLYRPQTRYRCATWTKLRTESCGLIRFILAANLRKRKKKGKSVLSIYRFARTRFSLAVLFGALMFWVNIAVAEESSTSENVSDEDEIQEVVVEN